MTIQHDKTWVAGLFALTACTSGEEPKQDVDAAQRDGSLYVIASSFITGDEIETYLVTTDSFDKSTKVDLGEEPTPQRHRHHSPRRRSVRS